MRHDSKFIANMDVKGQKFVTSQKVEEIANEVGAAQKLECSALKMEGIDEVFNAAISVAKSNQGGDKKPWYLNCHLRIPIPKKRLFFSEKLPP